ncbi:MAG TPA: hypothetical protein VFD43_08560 [Planctomycetota bacterium]|nr:hypothetical protein [Planctomycetota bacterium]
MLEPPEAPYAWDGGPLTDPRVELLFRPCSTLLTAAKTPRGLLAVSCCTRETGPASFPPRISMLFVWDVESGTLLRRIDGLRGDVLTAVLAADGSFLVVGTRGSQPGRPADGLVVCPLEGETAPFAIPGHEAGVNELLLFPDGERAASIGEDHVVRITDLAARKVLRAWTADEDDPPASLAARCDGQRVFVGGGGLSLRLFDPESDACLVTGTTRDESRPVSAEDAEYVSGDPRLPSAATFLPDDERLIVGDPSGRLALWDPRADGPPTPLAETGSPVRAIALSPDGGIVAAGLGGTWLNRRLRRPSNFSIPIVEAATGAPVTTLTGMWITPGVIGFLDDGERVYGVSPQAVRVWRLEPR